MNIEHLNNGWRIVNIGGVAAYVYSLDGHQGHMKGLKDGRSSRPHALNDAWATRLCNVSLPKRIQHVN